MSARLTLVQGDITRQSVDAIANAANASLVGGGGVDGAIHRAGGPAIMAECDRIRAVKGGCPTGTAVVTTAGKLAAKAVIHTAGPRWRGGNAGERELLASCYRSCLVLAAQNGFRTIAFPSISTGIYGYPLDLACEVAVATVNEALADPGSLERVIFACFSAETLQAYRRAGIPL